MSPPVHYALTELLIVAACIFSVNKLSRNNYYFALFGVALIGIAAAIGVIRFGLLNTEFIIQLNKILALYAGVLCLSLITTQIVFNLNFKNLGWLVFVLSILSIVSGLIWPKILLIKLIYFWSILSIILVFFIPDKKIWKKILKSILMSVLLISFLTVSKRGLLTNSLGADLSFHLYHVLIAIWVGSINFIIKEKNND
tara:strand:+ start:3163 stop:3756 length:594 start_codon:yes stop_codon:yes gene_type:complete